MNIAVVDIGSNIVKMKIYASDTKEINETYSVVNNAKLISYIKDNVLSLEGILLLCNIISEFKQLAKEKNADVFTCFATASLRRTNNVEDICNTVYGTCQEKIHLISGDDEAFYSFMGVKHTMDNFPDEAIFLDMGGGSTEIVYCKNKNRLSSESMGFGSLSLCLEHPGNDFDAMRKTAVDFYKKTKVYPKETKTAILVGGTSLAIYKLYRHFYKVTEDHTMTFENLKNMYEKLKVFDSEIIKLLEKTVPHRVNTSVSGLAAYVGLFEELKVENVTVSTCGIREGYVYEKILKTTENTTV